MFKIEKNVPFKEQSRGQRFKKYPWGEMEIGDSFFSTTHRGGVYNSARNASKGGKEFTCRVEGEGSRCWRIK